MLRLSKRLEMIAEEVPAGSRLADIGSDHALLPAYLAERGTIVNAVAGEVNPGPFEAAAKQVRSSGLEHRIDVRRGDGLEVIAPGEVDVITIAGMGGALIVSILEAGKPKLEGVTRLVLQPNVGESLVRAWLLEHNWALIGERIVEEDDKIYEILTAIAPGQGDMTNARIYEPLALSGKTIADRNVLLKMGPYLVREASSVWVKKWRFELEKLDKICAALGRSELDASRQKEDEFRQEMRTIEEVLACTQKARP
ncbi:tRNA (adenine(22)-N(1))-methyltransferase [Paenibacillus allorhizosphaerae]|uniref:tRNA (Adenine(22)-N(1))-methyltransferase n=1 Tax=Paenibacillus allorhizosphaerae TaxID=2849866 RepID=A0ABN7TCH4_9BACL|nr:class I SAM-dependent methyltransferase [Paenibacillus allorhizosphaerae]CAG7620162.1 tRNA (adenine(22)-N(1))-methyltransferase [Paenibacillus allorhizosphaerae]